MIHPKSTSQEMAIDDRSYTFRMTMEEKGQKREM